jgi:hypothetical protein
MNMRGTGEWGMIDMDEVHYNAQLEVGETPGEGKQDDLVYYLAVQPRHP